MGAAPDDHNYDGWLGGACGRRGCAPRGRGGPLCFHCAYPEACATSVMKATRAAASQQQLVRPTALLFHGPPGTGKTHAAWPAAESASLPRRVGAIRRPDQQVVWRRRAEAGDALSAVRGVGGRAVLFRMRSTRSVEAADRDGMHEASRRMLSVLLRQFQAGFDAYKHVALIGATNRPNDLDAALISRFDVRVPFPAPDAPAKLPLLFGRYAQHLSDGERLELAGNADGLSGRDILDACKAAERRWIYDELSSSSGGDVTKVSGGLRR